jgi:hypothetical protein
LRLLDDLKFAIGMLSPLAARRSPLAARRFAFGNGSTNLRRDRW